MISIWGQVAYVRDMLKSLSEILIQNTEAFHSQGAYPGAVYRSTLIWISEKITPEILLIRDLSSGPATVVMQINQVLGDQLGSDLLQGDKESTRTW